ncbi:glucose dehydrogenase [FAD, quinone]-like [Danaus plexippus]|nr:glucose dehydrogenase [FAD, quinone]-like [Danaus plexippus]
MTTWLPSDVFSICAEYPAPILSCSPAAYMYLSLVMRLFGGVNYSVNYPRRNPYSTLQYTHSSSIDKNPLRNSLSEYYPGPYLNPAYSRLNYNSYPHETHFDRSFNYNPFQPWDSIGGESKVEIKKEKNKGKDGGKSRRKRNAKEYDFIIVGAGSAGCVLANRLSEVKKWRVLLLEAGPEEPDVTMVPSLATILRQSSIDWRYETQPEPLTCRSYRSRSCPWTRGKTMGGSSAINYLVYMRGNRYDYDNWANLGNPGWSYNELLPYFRKSENNRDVESYDNFLHGVGGPITVERFPYVDINTAKLVAAFQDKGLPLIDLTSENNLGTNIGLSTSRDGRRMSINVAYIKPIRDVRPNIDIVVNAFATTLIIDPQTKMVLGVTYIKNGVTYNVFAKKEVIVSAGTINSPKLLMLSGIGPKEHLQSLNIPIISELAVGQNLQDHTTTDGLTIALSNKTSTLVSTETLLNEVQNYHQQEPKKDGPLATTNTLNAIAFIKTKYATVNAPDIQFHFDGRNVEDFYADPQTYLETNIWPLAFYNGLSARPLLLTPKSRGVILLNHTDPIFGPPLIYPRFFTVKEDLDALIEGLRFAVSLEETETFKSIGAHFVRVPVKNCENHIWGSYNYFACLLIEYTSTIYHPVGTCKMGPAWDKDAVVDSRLRVYGVKRLRVIDASIMPEIVRGNTNIPTVTIAERASDMIKEEYLTKQHL